MATLSHDGINLAYDDAGAGAPPLVFVHGFGGNRGEFSAQMAHFAPTHRVVAIDRRGHGDSQAPEGADYSVAAFADELAGVCDQLGLAPAVVVIHSFDRIAVDLAARFADRVAGLVIIDGPTAAGPYFDQAAADFLGGLRSPSWREAFRGFADALVFTPDTPVAVREAVVAVKLATPHHVLRDSWAGLVGPRRGRRPDRRLRGDPRAARRPAAAHLRSVAVDRGLRHPQHHCPPPTPREA